MTQIKPYVTPRTGIVCVWRGLVEYVLLCYVFICFKSVPLRMLITNFCSSCYLICFLGVFIVVCLNFRCYDVFYGCAIFKPFVKSQAVYSCPHKGLLRKCAVLLGLQRVFLGKCKCICLMLECIPKSKPGICSGTNLCAVSGADFG